MKKNSIEQLEVKKAQAQADRERLEKEAADMTAEAEGLRKLALECAEAGKEGDYLEFTEKAERLEKLATAKTIRAKALENPITDEEAQAAWRVFIAPADKKLPQELEKLDSCRAIRL